jgi:hypothetical protein
MPAAALILYNFYSQDYSDSSHNDEADHDEERAARKVHLIPSEIPTPAWQDIVMDRAAWNKMLRSTYTN